MIYNFCNVVTNDEILIWKEFQNSVIETIGFNNIMLEVVFFTNKGVYSVFNKVVNNSDKDDYSRICIEKIDSFCCTDEKIYLSENILQTLMIRDKLSWIFEHHKWIVTSDIGIKIHTKSFEIVILAIDDLSTRVALFIKKNNDYLVGNNDELSNELCDYWRFKTDNPIDFERVEIDKQW